NGDFVHLRLHRQFFCAIVTRGLRVEMTFDLNDDVKVQPSFGIHYIQLERNNGRLHHVIYGEGKPDQVIRIGMDIESSVPSINICAWAVSATGLHASTFHQVGTVGYLNIWDLQPNSAPKETLNKPQILSVPCAQVIIDLGDIHIAVKQFMSVNTDISPTGSYAIVAYSSAQKVEDLKDHFHAFNWTPTAPVDQNPSKPWPLQPIPTACDGKSYFGMCFHNYKRSERDVKEEERFCATDGRSVSIHGVQGNWDLIYKLEMHPESNIISALTPFTSMQGRYFAWSSGLDVISIWDIDTGKLVSHIYTGNNQEGHPALSRDGSMTAVFVNQTIQIYDTFTGIKLGVYRKGLTTDNYRNVILFGQDRFMTFNTLEATVNDNVKCDARSVVRVQDMSVVKSIRIHEDYRMKPRPNDRNPIFRYGF
ncbi:hypothetical protein BGX27_004529, partial [Mortierella sp. AM989]